MVDSLVRCFSFAGFVQQLAAAGGNLSSNGAAYGPHRASSGRFVDLSEMAARQPYWPLDLTWGGALLYLRAAAR